MTCQQWLTNKEEANDTKDKKKEPKDNNNTWSNKQRETKIEEKEQLPTKRNKSKQGKT